MAQFLLVQTLNGLAYGMLLFILALGLSMTFGLLRIVNFTHGSFFLIGAFAGVTVFAYTKNFALAAAAGTVLAAAMGLALERFGLQMFYNRSELDQVILSFGVALVLMDLSKIIWGGEVLSLPAPSWLSGSITIGPYNYPIYRASIIVVGVMLFVATWISIERTIVGALVRAAVWDRDMVRGLGLDIRGLFAAVFACGAGLAGLGGVLAAPITSVYVGLDFEVLITTMIVVVVGGLGSIFGAFWAGLIIGVFDTFGRALFPASASFGVFALMAVVLLLKSWGKAEEDVA